MAGRSRLLAILAAVLLAGGGALMLVPGTPFSLAATSGQGFAAEQDAGETPRVAFDKTRAMNYLRQICALGPRPSGSVGMKKQVELLEKHFREQGFSVELQKFAAKQRSQPEPTAMVNLIARWKPENPRRVILCTHYDSRPMADEEPNRGDWKKPFVAANDGGSGVALMMELAHHMKELNPAIGVDFVCFDAEEFIFTPRMPAEQGGDRYFIGSEHFAGQYVKNLRGPNPPRYVEAILLDMVAGKNSKFRWEENSWRRAGPVVERIWRIAAEVRSTAFLPEYAVAVLDDHLSLLDAGIPTIDIVPAMPVNRVRQYGDPFLDYPHWHRLSDIPENCSADTMEQVARVLVVWLKRTQ